MNSGEKFFGFYRGEVVDNDDRNAGDGHQYLCRCQVRVPQVYGLDIKDEDLPWAWPAGTVCGKGDFPFGLVAIPRKGSTVWVAFELGDPRSPVWLPSWLGDKGGPPEIGNHVIVDSKARVQYPEIVALKGSGRDDGCWFRIVGDTRIEIVHKENKNYIELDEKMEQIYIYTETWGVKVEAERGNVRIKGQNVYIEASDEVVVRGKRASLEADEKATIWGKKQSIVRSDDRIDGFAPTARGFDEHP